MVPPEIYLHRMATPRSAHDPTDLRERERERERERCREGGKGAVSWQHVRLAAALGSSLARRLVEIRRSIGSGGVGL